MKINPIMVGTGAGLACVAWTFVAIFARDFSEPNREFLVEMQYSVAAESQRPWVDDRGHDVLAGGLVEQPRPDGTVYRGQKVFPFDYAAPDVDADAAVKNTAEADRAEREWTLEKYLSEYEDSGRNFNKEAWIAGGKQLYEWNCSHCHGTAADGKSIVNQNYMPQSPVKSLVDPALNAMKRGDGWIYYVMTYGTGNMLPHGDKVQNLDDRWKVVLYVRSLQGR